MIQRPLIRMTDDVPASRMESILMLSNDCCRPEKSTDSIIMT
jgi:hypothetical protein